ncbi:MaoC/PaaZ C-terminal domain-containing protein [Leptospira interrogans]
MLSSLWEGLGTGTTLELGRLTFTREEIVSFAAEFDGQPFHLDDDAARHTLLGGLSASGWHTCITIANLLSRAVARQSIDVEIAGVGEVIWLKPVRPEDEIFVKVTWGEKPACVCGGGLLACAAMIEACNGRGERVLRWQADCIFRRCNEVQQSNEANCSLRRGHRSRANRRSKIDFIKFFDDIAEGDTIELGEYVFTGDRIADFRRQYFPGGLPEERCERTISGCAAPTAAGWHVAAAWMHCIVRYYGWQSERLRRLGRPVPLLGPAAGIRHLRWHAPVRAGTVISFRAWAERKLEISSHPDWGLLVVGAEGLDSRRKPVVSFYPLMLLQRSSSTSHSF